MTGVKEAAGSRNDPSGSRTIKEIIKLGPTAKLLAVAPTVTNYYYI